MNTVKHILTKKQAEKIGRPHLNGKEVDVILIPEDKMHRLNIGKRIASDIYLDGVRIGGTVSLYDLDE